MTEPAPAKRPRAPVAIPLAIMLIACLLIVTALVLIAQGAVARDAHAGRPAAGDGMVSERSELSAAATPSATLEGRFVLGREPTMEERVLAARIATSSSGGGLAVGAEILVVVEGGSAP
jgi:hypothetical protein